MKIRRKGGALVAENRTNSFSLVEGGRIRACYGHTLPAAIAYEEAQPPAVLYHGTALSSVEAIMEEGLLPMGRQMVHLSSDVETAMIVGRRHGGSEVVVLQVDTESALQEGVRFFRGNDTTWLADHVPASFLSPSWAPQKVYHNNKRA